MRSGGFHFPSGSGGDSSTMSYQTTPPWTELETPRFSKPKDW